jgi:hypothetical protein
MVHLQSQFLLHLMIYRYNILIRRAPCLQFLSQTGSSSNNNSRTTRNPQVQDLSIMADGMPHMQDSHTSRANKVRHHLAMDMGILVSIILPRIAEKKA